MRSFFPILIVLLTAFSLPASSPANDDNQDSVASRALFAEGQRDLSAHRDAEARRVFHRLLAGGMKTAPVYSNLGIACLRAGSWTKPSST